MNVRARVAAGGLVLVTVLAGCATTVSGSGSLAGGASAGSSVGGPSAGATDAPTSDVPSPPSIAPTTPVSTPAAAPPAGSACPDVKYLAAKIAFTCITSGMLAVAGNPIWPLLEIKRVDSSGWALQEGAARYTGPSGSLDSIILRTRSAMVGSGAYLESPDVITLGQKGGTFGSRRALYVESQITLDPKAAAKQGTKVRVERLWILAVQTGPGFVTLWHVSLPDLAKKLWPLVPKAIAGLKVQT